MEGAFVRLHRMCERNAQRSGSDERIEGRGAAEGLGRGGSVRYRGGVLE